MVVFLGLKAMNFKSPAIMEDDSIEKDFSLDNYRGESACVLFFYSLDYGQVDPTELIALNNQLEAFVKRDTKIIAISIDSLLAHKNWKKIPQEKGGLKDLKIPIVSDYTKQISQEYNTLLDNTYSCRATFVLDRNGYIRHHSMNDFPIGRNISEILRIIDAIDEHVSTGNLCPANWDQTKPTINYKDDNAANFLSKEHLKL